MPLPIVITMGDPAGIGPEIIAKAFLSEPGLLANCFVAGDVTTMRTAVLNLSQSRGEVPMATVEITGPQSLKSVPPGVLPVLQATLRSTTPVAMGYISAVAGQMAGESVVWAAQAALQGQVSALVTAPLHKEAMAAAGLPFSQFPGHTELLQAQAASFLGCQIEKLPVRMMLANDELRTVLVSIHLSLRNALDAVTEENVFQTLKITHESLQKSLGRKPKIAVAGLNPHAGEGGLFGDEEIRIIQPAMSRAKILGLDVSGPFAPDTIFMRARAQPGRPREFDVVLAMYHDQGLIPVKYLGVERGVNITLGLPLVRTSPDHGTAFDIAGQGKAQPDSLLAALHMARQLIG